ncbi:LacI family transcriptional regulator [Glaciecola punicea ACAM 611]|uniref:LacI family transcriptional regulator n=1 Tax=Glaciecola punicea ACAM 611 TaxID=1121923 RepID=H5TE96_9ALTE|nr:LacI family DNA-binding transcriptional regulator [Glaciecola punicea]GAB56623.1 LacI family transcriptional regulator [Glaciecola punicea ACAM 611]
MIKKEKKATINDVSRLAGVSKKTVSRIINNSPNVRAATREKVEKTIKILNYSPDPQARGLASQRSFLLGLVYDNPNASYVAEFQQGVLDHCRSQGYELVVHPCDNKSVNLAGELIRFISRLKLDGIVILPPLSANASLAELIEKSGCHCIRILPAASEAPAQVVQSNDLHGVRKIAQLLVKLGHTEIGFIHGPKDSLSAKERYVGFEKTLLDLGVTLPQQRIVWGEYTFDSGVACAEVLLTKQPRPTAIFASNDEMALGVILTAANMKIKIPDELSVIGYDDEPHASKIFPSLTTVNQNVREMGRLAAIKLVALCRGSGEEDEPMEHSVMPTLIERQSTARVKFKF